MRQLRQAGSSCSRPARPFCKSLRARARPASPSGTAYFEYTGANLPKKFAIAGGDGVEFRYDGALQRDAVVISGAATYYAWDGPRLLETRNADKTLKARFTHGRASIEGIGSCVEILRASDSKRFYCLFDHRGSAWKLLYGSVA
jgi:hypothetical protein